MKRRAELQRRGQVDLNAQDSEKQNRGAENLLAHYHRTFINNSIPNW